MESKVTEIDVLRTTSIEESAGKTDLTWGFVIVVVPALSTASVSAGVPSLAQEASSKNRSAIRK